MQDVTDALPLVGAFWVTLLAHEAGHVVASRRVGAPLYLPLLIPAGFGFLGSFGGITRFKGFVADRATLLTVALAGPAAGGAVSAAMLLLGAVLSASGHGDLTIDSPALADSFLVGALGQLVLGDALANPEVRASMCVCLRGGKGWYSCAGAGWVSRGRIRDLHTHTNTHTHVRVPCAVADS
jgi:hypothetical protein